MHLGDADVRGDLRLSLVPEEAEQQDRSFPFGQSFEDDPQCFVVLDTGDIRIVVAQQVAQRRTGVGAAARGGIDGQCLITVGGLQALSDFLDLDSQFLRHLAGGGRPSEALDNCDDVLTRSR